MRCIIADDEFPSREELKYFITEFSNLEIIKEFENGLDVLKFMENEHIDVAFLDINMPGLNGVGVAKLLSRINNKIKIIFITAYKEYAVEAFEIHAFDYLLKPYSEERILSCLKRLEDSTKKTDIKESDNINTVIEKITIIDEGKMYLIDADEIYYIEAHGKVVKVFTKNGEYISKNKISDIMKKLNKEKFYKCHRSYIVNLDKVKEVVPWFNCTYVLKLKDIGKEVPVSRQNTKTFRKLINM